MQQHKILLFTALTLLTARGAQALTFTGPPITELFFGNPLSGSILTAESFGNTLSFTGDIVLEPFIGSTLPIASATQPVSIPVFPEEISASFRDHYKLVVGGGDPEITIQVDIGVVYTLSEQPPATGKALGQTSSAQLTGNGSVVVDESGDLLPVLAGLPIPTTGGNPTLSPGNYFLTIDLFLNNMVATSGSANTFTPGVFIEFGGISTFDGFEFTVIGTPVPEPSSLAMLGLGGIVVLRRRHCRG